MDERRDLGCRDLDGTLTTTARTVLALSDGSWGFMAALVANAVALLGVYVKQRRVGVEVTATNRAVNHTPAGSPTLVERVGSLETDAADHRRWEHAAFAALATHVGCILPPHPQETK